MTRLKPSSILWPISIATGLSLLGDTTLYTVLPTHTTETGITLAMVGILLSANRWIRLPLNGPAGLMLEKLPRKPIFVLAMFLGTISTGLYALDNGFSLLFAARLLWGISWVGIWVGGNTIVMDITQENNRGKWIGVYQIAFYAGAGGGAAIGGLMTDALGYHGAMGVNAALTLIGAMVAWIFLPETQSLHHARKAAYQQSNPSEANPVPSASRAEFGSAVGLLAVNRLVMEGFLLATLALFVQNLFGEQLVIGTARVGTSTLTGIGLGLTTLVGALSAPISGALSDRAGSRWLIAGLALLPGAIGFVLLPLGSPAAITAGLIGASIASGSSANLSTALIGDLGAPDQHGRRLGGLFTIGDLTSAIGPPLAIWLQPVIGLNGVYLAAAAVFGSMATVSFFWAARKARLKPALGQ